MGFSIGDRAVLDSAKNDEELLRSECCGPCGAGSRYGINSYQPVRYCAPASSAVTQSAVPPSATSALPAKLATGPRPLQSRRTPRSLRPRRAAG